MSHLLRRLTRDRSGTAMIEFAFALPVILLIVLGCLEFGRYYWIRNTLELAVEEAARYATLNRNATQADIQTEVRRVLDRMINIRSFNESDVTVTVVATAGSNVTFKTITATMSTNGGNLRFMTNILPVQMLRLEARTRAVVPN